MRRLMQLFPTPDDLAINVRDTRRRSEHLRALTEDPGRGLSQELRQRLPEVSETDTAAVLLHTAHFLTHVPAAIRRRARQQGSVMNDYLMGEYTAAVIGAAGERLHTSAHLQATSTGRPAPAPVAPVVVDQEQPAEPDHAALNEWLDHRKTQVERNHRDSWHSSANICYCDLPKPCADRTRELAAIEGLRTILAKAHEPQTPPQASVQQAGAFLAYLRTNITTYHQPLPGEPGHCTCGAGSSCTSGTNGLTAIATLEAALTAWTPDTTTEQDLDARDAIETLRDFLEGWAASDNPDVIEWINVDQREYTLTVPMLRTVLTAYGRLATQLGIGLDREQWDAAAEAEGARYEHEQACDTLIGYLAYRYAQMKAQRHRLLSEIKEQQAALESVTTERDKERLVAAELRQMAELAREVADSWSQAAQALYAGQRTASAAREDKRGQRLNSEVIGAGAEGSQLITWSGDISQIEVRPSPLDGMVFAILGMPGLDPCRSEQTCPQVRVILTEEHARQLADGVYARLGTEAEHDADTRAVDSMITASVRGDSGAMALAFDNVRKRFIGRIAALDARDANAGDGPEDEAASAAALAETHREMDRDAGDYGADT